MGSLFPPPESYTWRPHLNFLPMVHWWLTSSWFISGPAARGKTNGTPSPQHIWSWKTVSNYSLLFKQLPTVFHQASGISLWWESVLTHIPGRSCSHFCAECDLLGLNGSILDIFWVLSHAHKGPSSQVVLWPMECRKLIILVSVTHCMAS